MPRAVIVTALPVEFVSVREHLTESREETGPQGTVYERGQFEANERTWEVLIVQAGMGDPRAAVETERAIQYFIPDVALFVGVAGGVKDVQLGDVVAATKVYGYEFGKADEEFRPRPEIGRSTYRMEQRAKAVARNTQWQERILAEGGESLSKALVAPLAAGAKVVSSNKSEVFALLRANYSDAVAVEMEGLGFLEATFPHVLVEALVVRGISDLIEGKAEADAEGWQGRASRNAAAFAFEVLASLEIPGGGGESTGFETIDNFFQPFMDPTRIFGHVIPLVGREHYLHQLQDFVSSTRCIAVLSGRGGIGKSKVLKEALMQIEIAEGGPRVFLLEDLDKFDRSMIKALPSGPLLLVVDDAHRMQALGELLAAVRADSNRLQLVLAMRPYAIPIVREEIRQARFSTEECLVLPEIGPLTRPEMVMLAREALGETHAHLANHLVAVTGDSPLVTVVAAHLLVQNQIDPGSLIDAELARDEIFGRFRDVLLGQLGEGIDPEMARQVLDLVSALGPFRADHAPLAEQAATFIGIPVDHFHRFLEALAESGALIQFGGTFRVTPDLLSDYILKRAAVKANAQPTGYADRIFTQFGDLATGNLLANLADLLPDEVLRFIRSIIDRGPIEIPEPTLEAVLSGVPSNPYEGLPPILLKLSGNTRLRAEAFDLLWLLGRDDKRNPDQNLTHPIRVLQDLAKIEVGQDQAIYDALLDAVERWIGEPDAFSHKTSPLDVLNPLLKKEASDSRVEGNSIVWWDYPTMCKEFGGIRRRAVRILEGLTRRDSPVVQYRALTLLLESLWSPIELATAIADDEEVEARTRESTFVFTILQHLLDRTGSKVLACAVEKRLRYMVRKGGTIPSGEGHRQFLATLPSDFDSKLARYLWRGLAQIDYFADEADYSRRGAAIDRELSEVVEQLINQEKKAHTLKLRLERELDLVTQYGVDPSPNYVLSTMAQCHPDVALQLSELIIADPDSALVTYLHALLIPLSNAGQASFRQTINLAAESHDARILAGVALTLGNIGRLADEERRIIRRLAVRTEPNIVHYVLRALARFPADSPSEVDEIAMSLDIGSSPEQADALCKIYETQAKEGLSQGQWDLLLGKLVIVEDIPGQGSPVHDLVDLLVRTDPVRAVEFFVERIQHRKTECAQSGSYRPLPSTILAEFSVGDADPTKRREALSRIGHMMIAPEGLSRHWLVKLFAIMANRFDVVSLDVLAALITEEGRHGVRQVSLLLREAPEGFVFAQIEFVERLLTAARDAGPDAFSQMQSQLISAASSGGGIVLAGEPRPYLVALKQQAEAAAAKFAPGSLVRSFFDALTNDADDWIRIYLEHDYDEDRA